LQPTIQEEKINIREQSRPVQYLEELLVLNNANAFDVLKQGAKIFNPKVKLRKAFTVKKIKPIAITKIGQKTLLI
jgi:hypothetical protein